MRISLTVEEAIYILNRIHGTKITDTAELIFHMDNSKRLALKFEKLIDKELLKENLKGMQNDNSGN